ncbi:hypothetical protein BDR06DRAFT_967984 [Suillus hirtellus]|nr:hypothetical protein BDR06DRAFT_967984 [Suillus hirtellus]
MGSIQVICMEVLSKVKLLTMAIIHTHHSQADLNSTVACLIADVMSVTNDALTVQVNGLDEIVKTLQAESKKPQKKVMGKHILNDHPTLKCLIQPTFCDLCGIESSMGRNKCTEALMKVKPLGDGHAYKMHQGDEGDKQGEEGGGKTWHLNWLGHIDEAVNAMFIKEIIDHVYNNEKCHHESPDLKAEVPHKDFNMQVIMQCMKDYFCNIHKQAMCHSDTSKAQKAEQKKEHGCQRACCAAVTKSHCATAVIYEKETGREGAVVMIDTDFASDILSYSEDNLSEDTLTRQMKSGAGNSANMVVGLEWQSSDYVAFLCFLTLQQMRGNNKATTADTDKINTIQPPKKCRKTAEGGTRSKRIMKKTFDISPEQMNEDTPLSAKKNLPFENMVADSWKNSHPDMEMLEGVPWLKGFWASLTRDDLIKEDYEYLEELEEWHKQKGDEVLCQMTNDPVRVDKGWKLGLSALILSQLP